MGLIEIKTYNVIKMHNYHQKLKFNVYVLSKDLYTLHETWKHWNINANTKG